MNFYFLTFILVLIIFRRKEKKRECNLVREKKGLDFFSRLAVTMSASVDSPENIDYHQPEGLGIRFQLDHRQYWVPAATKCPRLKFEFLKSISIPLALAY